METKKIDRRIIKTKRAIHSAFADLLSEKELAEITIKDIADTAEINRKTFYTYYNGIYDLVDELENELVQTFEEEVSLFDFRQILQNPGIVYQKITEAYKKSPDFYNRLFKIGNNASLQQKLADAIKKKAVSLLVQQKAADYETARIFVEYNISGIVAVYQYYYSSGGTLAMEDSMERMVKILQEIIGKGMSCGLIKVP